MFIYMCVRVHTYTSFKTKYLYKEKWTNLL